MSNVQLGYTQVIDPISFKSIPSGKIYIGEYGTLPNPANAVTWKQAYFVNSDGTRTAASQPIRTNSAGYAVDGSGNIKTVQVDGLYSLIVQDQFGATKFSNESPDTGDDTVLSFDSISSFTSAPDGSSVYFKGRSSAGDGGGGVFNYYSGSTQPVDGGMVFDTALGTGRLIRDGWTVFGFNGEVSVKFFGAVGDGATNDTSAFSLALAYCKTSPTQSLIIPDATYLLNAGSLNFAAQGLSIKGIGKPKLKFTGSGMAFVLDTLLADGSVFSRMRVENLIIEGGALVTDGFYSRGIVRSEFIDIEVRECSGKAFNILHGVSNLYSDLKYSTNDIPQTTKPTYGFYLTNNGAGYYTADCTFVNCVAEGFTGTACYLNDASGNVFIGGTFEGMTGKGLEIGTSSCRRNTFKNVWFEANTVNDALLRGADNAFDDCYFGSASSGPNVDIVNATTTKFRGGFVRQCNLQIANSRTYFDACSFSDNVSLGITGAGASSRNFTRINCVLVDTNLNVTSKYADIVGDSGTWTPTVSQGGAVAATVSNADYQRVGNHALLTADITVNAAGTGGSAVVISGIPSTLAIKSTEVGSIIGTGVIRFAGVYSVVAVQSASTTQLSFIVQGGTSSLGISPATALASNDLIKLSINYQIN